MKQYTEEMVLEVMEKEFGDEPISKARELAECWIIDHNGLLPNETKESIKAQIKGATKGITSEEKEKKKRAPREKDEEKVAFISKLAELLAQSGVENVEIANVQKEITFLLNGNEYSISLIKHRPPKK